MAQLAIQGHATRGNEVIALLEMLGGNNANNCYGDYHAWAYYINENGYIDRDFIAHIEQNTNFIIYTLEEFLEKFPYKVGDKVLYKTYGIYSKIKSMLWNEEKEQVFYRLESNKLFVATADELKTYKEETMEDNVIDTVKESDDRYRIVLNHQFDMEVDEGEYYAVRRKPQYPKTYVECAEILNCFGAVNIDGYKGELLDKLQELIICRDAYWKLAGEEMGLGKSWKQDYDNRGFIIANNNGNIHTYEYHGNNNIILAFPTAEMRNTFYENFKDLIEQCKELL